MTSERLNEIDDSPVRESQPCRRRDGFQGKTCIALYLRDIRQVKRLTPQEEIELATRTRNGDRKAREEMILANLPLVIKIARAYEGIGLPLLDIISEGNIGLMRAVERFDPSKGAKLSGYGALWIRQAITKALASQSKTMRLPTHVVEELGKLRRASLRLDEELAVEVGTTSRRVTQLRMAASYPVSLDAQIDGEGTRNYGEIVPDEKAESPYQKLEDKARTAMLGEAIRTLNEREQAILRLRFGLNGEPPKTLDEIGETLGVSSERVRQLQEVALRKLRRRIKNLENCLATAKRAFKPVRSLN
jgi:RNA polymerase primary sigma factor